MLNLRIQKLFRVNINIRDYTWQIVLNPNAMSHRCGEFWNSIEEHLKNGSINYQYHITESIEESKLLVSKLCADGARHFIVIGGDGTLNTFVNSILNAGINAEEVFIVPVMMGTGNDWARTHFNHPDFLTALDVFVKGTFVKQDLGLIEIMHHHKKVDHRYFINIAGFAFDAAVIVNSKDKKPKMFPQTFYLMGIFNTLMKYKAQKIELISPDFYEKKKIFTLAVGIGKFNGNGMKQCPDASPIDALFDVLTIDDVSKMKVIANVKNLFNGKLIERVEEANIVRTNTLEIKSHPYIRCEVEGELIPAGDYKITCLPRAINILSEKWS